MTRLGAGPCVLAQVLQPRERLHGFAETHVVGEQRAELEARGVGEEMEARFLVGPQLGDEALRLGRFPAGP